MNKKPIAAPTKPHRINEEIRALQVRLLDSQGEQIGIVAMSRALSEALSLGLDLVEINPNSDPPVCRLMNYGKFLYERNKASKQQKKRQKNIQVKEIKFRPTTDIGDYQLKLKRLTQFLEDGDKVKVTVIFRGREIVHQQLGRRLLERLKSDTAAVGLVESHQDTTESKQLVMMLGPKRKT